MSEAEIRLNVQAMDSDAVRLYLKTPEARKSLQALRPKRQTHAWHRGKLRSFWIGIACGIAIWTGIVLGLWVAFLRG
jgi:hypothetical protein